MNQLEDESRPKPKCTPKKMLIVVLIAMLIGAGGMYYFEHRFTEKEEPHTADDVVTVSTEAESNTITLEQKKVPYKVHLTLNNVLIEEGRKESKLIVMEQDCTASYTVKKDGLLSLPVYAQSKSMIFHGLATYTVDLSEISENNFTIDNDNSVITIHIPEPKLSVQYLPDETEFFSSKNGLLRFGEMQLTQEDQQEMEVAAMRELEANIRADNKNIETAEKFAKLSVKDIYEPIIRKLEDAAVAAENDEYAIPMNYSVNVVID